MGERNFLVEGVSGTGKTAVCAELARRGYQAINGDRELAYQGDPASGRAVVGVTGLAVHDHHLWSVDALRDVVADRGEPVTFLCGGSRNVTAFIDLLDGVFVLEVDLATLRRRLAERSDGEWGARPEERELVERLHRTGEDTPPGIAIDATAPVGRLVDEILRRSGLPERRDIR